MLNFIFVNFNFKKLCCFVVFFGLLLFFLVRWVFGFLCLLFCFV